ncbi:MAG: Spore germination protein [Clostridia bacterium 62_21]|nr:MAG: Spore germination protein [Clostridia bacterium 62_21]
MPEGKPHIGYAEAVALLVYFVVSKVFLSYHVVAVDRAATAAWQAVLLAVMVGGSVLLAVLVALLRPFPGRSIVEVGEAVAGRWVNALFAAGYFAFFIAGNGLELRQYSEQIVAGLIPEMPISVAVFSFISCAGVAAYLGIEAVARTARLFFWYEWISFAAILLGTLPFWDFAAVRPPLGNGPLATVKTGLGQLGLVSDLFLLAVIYPFIPRERTPAIGRAVIVHSTLALTLLVLVLLLAFPYPVAREVSLATYELSRLIYLGRFVQRLETLFLPMWGIAALVATAAGLWAAAYVAAGALRLPYWRPLLPATMVLVVATAFVAPNIAEAMRFHNELFYRYLAPAAVFGPPIILLLLAGRRRRDRRG